MAFGRYFEEFEVGQVFKHRPGRTITEFLEYSEVKHVSPVFHGDSIYAESRIVKKQHSRNKPDRGVIYVETTAYNQNQEVVLTLKRTVLVPKTPHDPKPITG